MVCHNTIFKVNQLDELLPGFKAKNWELMMFHDEMGSWNAMSFFFFIFLQENEPSISFIRMARVFCFCFLMRLFFCLGDARLLPAFGLVRKSRVKTISPFGSGGRQIGWCHCNVTSEQNFLAIFDVGGIGGGGSLPAWNFCIFCAIILFRWCVGKARFPAWEAYHGVPIMVNLWNNARLQLLGTLTPAEFSVDENVCCGRSIRESE